MQATRKYAAELVALRPDVILAIGNVTLAPLLEATCAVPIVFTVVIDPVGAGFVETLSRPGGNVTGFMMFEYSLSVKWLEFAKAGDAGDWILKRRVAWPLRAQVRCFPPGFERNGLRRGPQRGDRKPLGGRRSNMIDCRCWRPIWLAAGSR